MKIKWVGIVRIVGLCLVLFYHFFTERLPGGFIGVDVFFTFSGYLITALFLSEVQRKGTFSLSGFFKRRTVRIVPPFVLAVLFTLPFTLLIDPDFRAGLGRQIAAALGFMTNYYEIQTGGSYEAKMLPHLYVHTWSLAVEVQLYILWAVLCKILSMAAGKKNVLRPLVIAFSLCAFIASFLYMQVSYGTGLVDPSPVYFDTLTRSFPFFLGSAAGAVFGVDSSEKTKNALNRPRVRVIGVISAVLAAAGLFLLAANIDFIAEATYRYGILFASLFTVVLIYALRVLHETTPENIREPRAITSLADLSYCIFLMHWPLMVVFENIRAVGFRGAGAVFGAAMAITLAFSAFIFYFAEPLLRASGKKSETQTAATIGRESDKLRTIAAVAAATKRATAAVILVVIVLCTGFLSGYSLITAPGVSSLEDQMTVGFLYQDADLLSAARRGGKNLNENPVMAVFENTDDFFLYFIRDTHSVAGGYLAKVAAEAAAAEAAARAAAAQDMPDDAPPVQTPPASPPTIIVNPPPEPPVLPPAPPRPVVVRPNRPVNEDGIPQGVFVIGDSVCLGARRALLDAIPDSEVDAAQNRQMWQGHEMLLELQDEGLLPEYVVIALGTNTNRNALDRVDAIIRDINPGHRLVFVTPYNGGVGPDSITNHTAAHIRTLPELYPFVSVADWAGIIGPQDHVIGADRCHIGGNRAAIAIYVDTILAALAEAAEKPAAGEEVVDTLETP